VFLIVQTSFSTLKTELSARHQSESDSLCQHAKISLLAANSQVSELPQNHGGAHGITFLF
jgi:hypothetical protein